MVQYVTVSNNQALLRVNDEYYSMDQFDSVVDWEYIEFLNKQNGVENNGKPGNGEDDGKTDDTDKDEK